jgi:hypothetical protein
MKRWRALLGVVLVLPVGAAVARAQEKQESTAAPPSLDELLGLEEQNEREAADLAREQSREELERRLSDQAFTGAFEQAIAKMEISADQLDQKFDTGLGTQRVQEEVLAQLERLIDESRNRQGQSSGGASAGAAQQQPTPTPGRRQQQQGDPADQGSQRNQTAGNSQEMEPPGPQHGDINNVIDESRAEWGNLPPRLRDEMIQGSREKFSSLYEQLTEAYYRRLAEESAP